MRRRLRIYLRDCVARPESFDDQSERLPRRMLESSVPSKASHEAWCCPTSRAINMPASSVAYCSGSSKAHLPALTLAVAICPVASLARTRVGGDAGKGAGVCSWWMLHGYCPLRVDLSPAAGVEKTGGSHVVVRKRKRNKVARNSDALSAALVQAQHLDGRPQHPRKCWNIMTESLMSIEDQNIKATVTKLRSPKERLVGTLMPCY